MKMKNETANIRTEDAGKRQQVLAGLASYKAQKAATEVLIAAAGNLTPKIGETIKGHYRAACDVFANDNEVRLAKAVHMEGLVYDWRTSEEQMNAAINSEDTETIRILLSHLSDFLGRKMAHYEHWLKTGTFRIEK